MSDVAYTLQVGRKAFAHRRCLVCTDREDAIAALGQEGSKRVLSGRADESRRPVIFMLPGIGDHYVGMAPRSVRTWPVFKEEVDRCSRILQPHLGIDIRTVIYPGSSELEEEATARIDLRRCWRAIRMHRIDHRADVDPEMRLQDSRASINFFLEDGPRFVQIVGHAT